LESFFRHCRTASILLSNNITFVLIEGQNVNIDCPKDIIKIKERQYEAIYSADAAIVCSGTATLETAMLRCPMIVCYKLSTPTWYLAKLMSKVKYLSLGKSYCGRRK
jgi:lipid-A-disaccharide synthase